MVVHCNNNEWRKFLATFYSFCPNMKFIDLGMDRIMLLCMQCSFLWRKITFHHRFNKFPINALLTAIKMEFSGLDNLVKNQFRGRVGLTMQIWPLLQVIVILVWVSNPKKFRHYQWLLQGTHPRTSSKDLIKWNRSNFLILEIRYGDFLVRFLEIT